MKALTWPEVQARIGRARAGIESGQYKITYLPDHPTPDEGHFRFTVENGDGVLYSVSFHDGKPLGACTCPDYIRYRTACKHIAMVVLTRWPERFDRWAEKVRAMCRPVDGEPAQPEPKPEPKREQVDTEYLRRVVHDALLDALPAMEEQLLKAILPAVQGNGLRVRA